MRRSIGKIAGIRQGVRPHGLPGSGRRLGLALAAVLSAVLVSAGCGGSSETAYRPLQGETLVVVSPHPDDEDIMAAGTIFRYAHDPSSVVEVVYLSSGDAAGLPGPCREKTEEEKRRKIVALREEEARQACHILGVDPAHIHFLRYPDRQLVSASTFSGGRRQDTLTEAGEAATAELVELVPALVPQGTGAVTIITTSLWDAHPDHRTAYWAARMAASKVAAARGVPVRLLSAIVHDEFPGGPAWCCLGDVVWPNEGPYLDYATLSNFSARPRPPLWDVLYNVADLASVRRDSLGAHASQVAGNAELCMVLVWKAYYERWMEKVEEAFYEECFGP